MVLFVGQVDGSFVDVIFSIGSDLVVKNHEMVWGVVWLDYDNDS